MFPISTWKAGSLSGVYVSTRRSKTWISTPFCCPATFTTALVDNNVLMTYRVNSGTAFYLGYDDHYAQGDAINSRIFSGTALQRTNRAFFTKVQYLFRRN